MGVGQLTAHIATLYPSVTQCLAGKKLIPIVKVKYFIVGMCPAQVQYRGRPIKIGAFLGGQIS